MPDKEQKVRPSLLRLPHLVHLPRQAIGVLWKEAFYRHVGFWEHRSGTRSVLPHVPLPPAHLRARIGSATSIGSFLAIGKTTCQNMSDALECIGKPLHSFRSILDFGCGCGRTLVWVARWHQEQQGTDQHAPGTPRMLLAGTDIDASAIAWCCRHLPFADFQTNGPLPPLPFASATFDLVYTISVFTHLNEKQQGAWMCELSRVLQPGGIALVTVLGYDVWKHLPPHHRTTLQERGLLFVGFDVRHDLFPQSYQTAYHSRDYVERLCSPHFTLLDYLPRGVNHHQDLVVLRRP